MTTNEMAQKVYEGKVVGWEKENGDRHCALCAEKNGMETMDELIPIRADKEADKPLFCEDCGGVIDVPLSDEGYLFLLDWLIYFLTGTADRVHQLRLAITKYLTDPYDLPDSLLAKKRIRNILGIAIDTKMDYKRELAEVRRQKDLRNRPTYKVRFQIDQGTVETEINIRMNTTLDLEDEGHKDYLIEQAVALARQFDLDLRKDEAVAVVEQKNEVIW